MNNTNPNNRSFKVGSSQDLSGGLPDINKKKGMSQTTGNAIKRPDSAGSALTEKRELRQMSASRRERESSRQSRDGSLVEHR